MLAACNSSETSETTAATAASASTALAKPAADTTTRAGTAPLPVQPAGPKPAWVPGIHPEMQAVIEQLEALSGPTPLAKMTPQKELGMAAVVPEAKQVQAFTVEALKSGLME